MQNIQDIENSIANLSPDKLAEFRAWFHAFDAEEWDKQIERDIASGKLDKLAVQAREEFAQGRCKEL